MLESSTKYVYKSIAVSADDNPHILSGNIAHGGIALLWKRTIDDFVTPLENIESDHIVGGFDNCDSLFILSVHLPSSIVHSFYLTQSGNSVEFRPLSFQLPLASEE